MLERGRAINGQSSIERAIYIGSKGIVSAEVFAHAARSHWGVESRLHWVLDVTFREDDCRGTPRPRAAESFVVAQVWPLSAASRRPIPQAQPALPPQNR